MTINQPTIVTNFGVRSTFVEVNLSQLSRNLQAIREKVSPAKIMIVVKANAYGHGLTEVAKYLDPKVDYIAVAVLEEGILLREIGVQTPILVLGGIWGDQIPAYIENDLTLTAPWSNAWNKSIRLPRLRAKERASISKSIPAWSASVYIITMPINCWKQHSDCKHVEVEGIFSHFANADAADLSMRACN